MGGIEEEEKVGEAKILSAYFSTNYSPFNFLSADFVIIFLFAFILASFDVLN